MTFSEELLSTYVNGLDRADLPTLGSCITDDFMLLSGSHVNASGKHEALEFLASGLQAFTMTMHALSNHICTVAGDEARAETYCLAFLKRKDDESRLTIKGLRYEDHLVRIDGGAWLMAKHITTPLLETTIAADV